MGDIYDISPYHNNAELHKQAAETPLEQAREEIKRLKNRLERLERLVTSLRKEG